MTEYKRINESTYLEFGRRLSQEGSDKKVVAEQLEFLQACRDGKDSFLEYLDNNLLTREDAMVEGKGVFFDYRFTETEFRFPPMDTQAVIWEAFKNIPRQNMGLAGFWGSVVVDMIKHDCISPDYLASNVNGVNETGLYMLDSAINSEDGKKIDDCVRRVLRSMGCPPAGRGKRIIFNDFYLGKAYWRWNWADKMSGKVDLTFDEVLRIFDETSYTVFSEKMHSKKSYISQVNVLGGLLLFLNKNNLKGKLKAVIDTISYISAWKAIEVQDPKANYLEIKKIVASAN